VPQYEVIEPIVRQMWLAAEQPCGKRLAPILRQWLPFYEKRYGAVSGRQRTLLRRVSPATLDRLLSGARAEYPGRGRGGTKPGSLLRTEIPIRTGTWDLTRPGYLEADSVAHCGASLAGDFIWSLTYTDIFSGWTEGRAVWNKGAAGVVAATQDVEEALPFGLLGFDCDNGSEFLNHHLKRYLLDRERPVNFTRSRAYRKNDNAHVEQKNWTHVRELLGYDRLENPAMLPEMNALYLDWEKLNNFFKPSMKLVSKVRIKSRYFKTYDRPCIPFERLKASGILSKEQDAALEAEYEALDPFKLERRIQQGLRRIEKMKSAAGSPQSGSPGLPTAFPSLTTLQPTGTQ
jgi:hypothetical protein